MRVSTQYPIAVHALLMVAAFPEKKMTSDVIAVSAGVNPVIIRNVFAKLVSANMLVTKSGRGKTELARPAEEITLWDIYVAVESPDVDEIFKFHKNVSETCVVGSNIHELLAPHLNDAVDAMQKELSAVTLADLRDELFVKIA